MKKEEFLQSINDLRLLGQKIEQLYPDIEETVNIIYNSIKSGGKLMVCGNGGSAADAQHMAAEFVNRFLRERKPLPALALSTDTSNLTSIANDYSFEDIFSKQVEALGKKGDILMGISTSGNSKNVIKAVETANDMGITTVGLLGKDGGSIAGIANKSIMVPSDSTPRIQEMHIFIIHTICQMIEDEVCG